MNIKKSLLVSITILLMSNGNAWAVPGFVDCLKSGGKVGCVRPMPEIDAATATVPFALLTGIVLLMKERSRSKRDSESGE